MTGRVVIDTFGNREPDYIIENYRSDGYVTVAFYHREENKLIYTDEVVEFGSGVKTAPRDHPPCGWENELCSTETGTVSLQSMKAKTNDQCSMNLRRINNA